MDKKFKTCQISEPPRGWVIFPCSYKYWQMWGSNSSQWTLGLRLFSTASQLPSYFVSYIGKYITQIIFQHNKREISKGTNSVTSKMSPHSTLNQVFMKLLSYWRRTSYNPRVSFGNFKSLKLSFYIKGPLVLSNKRIRALCLQWYGEAGILTWMWRKCSSIFNRHLRMKLILSHYVHNWLLSFKNILCNPLST